MINTVQDLNSVPYRIRIGVAGHRDLSEKEAILEKVKLALKEEIFKLFDAGSQKLILNATKTPLIYSVISPLAEGADRLIAGAVLDYDNTAILHVVLPLTLSDYRESFSNPADKEFDDLYNKARSVITLKKCDILQDPEITGIRDNDNIKDAKIKDFRREAYKKAGKYVVDNCDVLIAVWNGQEGKKEGQKIQ
jgi:hypothetical protein